MALTDSHERHTSYNLTSPLLFNDSGSILTTTIKYVWYIQQCFQTKHNVKGFTMIILVCEISAFVCKYYSCPFHWLCSMMHSELSEMDTGNVICEYDCRFIFIRFWDGQVRPSQRACSKSLSLLLWIIWMKSVKNLMKIKKILFIFSIFVNIFLGFSRWYQAYVCLLTS